MRSWLLASGLAVALAVGSLGCGDSGGGNGGGGDAGGDGGNGGGNCENIAGTWGVTGECGPDTCIITQTNCSTNFDCSGGAASYTGTVSGSSVSYSGTTATGAPGSCTGTVSGNTMTGTCTSAGVTCSYAAARP